MLPLEAAYFKRLEAAVGYFDAAGMSPETVLFYDQQAVVR